MFLAGAEKFQIKNLQASERAERVKGASDWRVRGEAVANCLTEPAREFLPQRQPTRAIPIFFFRIGQKKCRGEHRTRTTFTLVRAFFFYFSLKFF